MNIINKSSSTHTTYKKNRSIKYIAIHYTAGVSSSKGKAQSVALMFANPNSRDASADFIVDDAEIVQYNPDIRNRYCWAVGASAKYNTKGGSLWSIAINPNTISIEICSTNNVSGSKPANDPSWKLTDAAVNNAIELTKYLMKEYNIPVENVIRHYDATGKLCPGVVGWNKDSGDESKWKKFKEALILKPQPSPTPVIEKGDFAMMTELQKELFVKNVLYLGLLDREADPAGLKYWVSQLNDKVSLSTILNNFMELEEYRSTTVKVAYRRLLNREPDKDALVYWTQWLKGEKSADDLYTTLKNSDEYKKLHNK